MAEPVVIEVRVHDAGGTATLAKVRTELRAVGAEASRTGRLAGTAGASGLSRMEVASQRLHKAAGAAHERLRSMSTWMGSQLEQNARRGAIGITVLVAAIAGFGLKAASNFQQARLAFDTLLGSAAAGKALFTQLQQINLKTPFQLGEIAPATQLLLRYGVAANQVVPVLKSLLDAAALSGDPSGNLQKLSLAVGQVVQKGKLEGQEARQLAEAGVDAYGLMAVQLGKTRAEVIKLGEAGKLSSDTFVAGITAQVGPLEKLRGGAEKMSQTLMGQLSNLKDAVNVRLADASAPLVEKLSAQIPALTELVGTAVDKVGPPVFELVGLLAQGLTRVLPIVAPLLAIIVTQLGRLLTAAGPALTALEPLGGEIGTALVQFVDELVPIMPDLVALLIAMVQILPDFIRLLTDLLPAIDALARFATALLEYEPVRKILAGLLVVLLGYRALSGIVSTLWGFASGLRAIAAAETEATAASAGGGGLGAVGLGKIAGGLAGAAVLYGGIADAQKSGPTAGNVLAGAAGGALTGAALGSVLPGVGTGVGAVAGGVIGGGAAYLSGLFGDVNSNLARSARVHSFAAGMTAGRSPVTSTVRNFGVTGAGSGHVRGTAWDAHPDYPQTYAANIRRLGGFAAIHDQGSGRHVHAQIGDTTPIPTSRSDWGGDAGLPPVIVHIGNVSGVDDLEAGIARGVRRGIDRTRRRDIERARDSRMGGPS